MDMRCPSILQMGYDGVVFSTHQASPRCRDADGRVFIREIIFPLPMLWSHTLGADHRLLSSLIDHIYMAAVDSDCWPDTLRRIAEAFDGRQVTFYSHDLIRKNANIDLSWGIDPVFLESYTQNFAALNPFVEPVARLSTGAHATAADLLDSAQYENSEFYNDWVRPQGCKEFITTQLFRDETSLSGITVLRGSRMFDAAERDLWASLSSHLRRAIQVHAELCAARLGRDGAVEALNILSVGIVLAGTDGKVLLANPVAETMLRAKGGLRMQAGRLCAEPADASEALSRSIATAAAAHGSSRATRVLALPNRSGHPIPVLVSPLSRGSAPLVGGGQAALVVIGGARRTRVPLADLMSAFRLTPAEARLLAALVEGGTLLTYAKDNAIAIETVRVHLRKVLAKTGSTRQADAIRRVLSDPVLARAM